MRERLPDTRPSLTRKVECAGFDLYVTVGFHADGRPGELFVRIGKAGSTLAGLVDWAAQSISIALQNGADWPSLVEKSLHQAFPPSDDASPSLRHAIMAAADELVKQRQEVPNDQLA